MKDVLSETVDNLDNIYIRPEIDCACEHGMFSPWPSVDVCSASCECSEENALSLPCSSFFYMNEAFFFFAQLKCIYRLLVHIDFGQISDFYSCASR